MKRVNRDIILLIASMGIFVEALDIAIVNLAIPEIEKDLGLTNHSSYQLQSLYILTYGCFLVLGGKLSDFFGRKKIFLWGTGIFLLTSLGAGLSHTFYSLLTFRILQGLGAALLMPAAFSIVNYYFTEPEERSKAIAVFSSFAAIGSASGLSVGGIITSYLGWSWVFLINVPILVVVMAVIYFILEKDTSVNSGLPDIPSAIVMVLVMLCITWTTDLLSEAAEHYPGILLCITGAAVLTWYLYTRLKTQASPLLSLEVLSLSSLKKGNLLFVLLGALFTGYLFMMSFLVQKNFHFSAASSGFLMMPFNILSVIVARFALPKIVGKISSRHLAVWGNLAMLAGAICLVAAVQYHNLVFLVAGGSFIAGIGMTLCFTGYSVIAMERVPAEHLGVGGSLTTTSYLVGGGLGLPLFAAFMDTTAGVTNSKPVLILLAIALLCIGILKRDDRQSARD
ncbi:MFS family permease [Chitinophaga terrae (ex Kim and Jung 2007)]|uniref:MFS transporter n=1 Tax=Chitinophaga terrae (ex Kim and Jung 2007) TaxID=408074 RepID=UPI002783ECA9|nr:MFS transporter [Chitinophaga terrae (ex Kim and Jung 2007)]MDQ0107388.1 MFS family permease [Chitinophaga terrae (ex Kim and Jung 2007)]